MIYYRIERDLLIMPAFFNLDRMIYYRIESRYKETIYIANHPLADDLL